MRLIRISTNYPTYLHEFYRRRPQLKSESYSAQYDALMDDCFGWANFLTHALGKLGYELWEPVGNAEPQQKAWASEHGIAYDEEDWLRDILTAQVKAFRPDILFVNDYHTYARDFVEDLRDAVPSIRAVIGWCGAPYADAGVFHAYDMVLSNITSLVEHFRDRGHRSEEIRHAFDPGVLTRIRKEPGSRIPFSFVGSVVKNALFHNEREELLTHLVRHSDLQIWSDIQAPPIDEYRRLIRLKSDYAAMRRLRKIRGGAAVLRFLPRLRGLDPADEPDLSKFPLIEIAERANRPVYGVAMYQLLHDSAVTLNSHIDISAQYANNMRLYEATGVGTCLLTDWKANLPDMFTPDHEVVAYWNAEEAVEKARYLLAHEDERRRIAEAGQRRTLRDHTFDVRAGQLDEIIRKLSAAVSGGSRRAGHLPLANSEAPAGVSLIVVDPSLKGQVGIDPILRVPDWGLERSGEKKAFLWLGRGRTEGLHATLWAASTLQVVLEVEVLAGPARQDSRRTLHIVLKSDSTVQDENLTFDRHGVLRFAAELTPGRSRLDIEVLDLPTVRLPTDSRPLLVRLVKLEIKPYDGSQFGPPGRSLITLSAELREKALLGPEIRTPSWSIEADEMHSWLWLGSGPEESFGGTIRSRQELEVRFEFDVRPGPSRADQIRTLLFRLENQAGATTQTQQISEPCRVAFKGALSKGVTAYGLQVVEPATCRIPTDQRPLLLCIRDIRISE